MSAAMSITVAVAIAITMDTAVAATTETAMAKATINTKTLLHGLNTLYFTRHRENNNLEMCAVLRGHAHWQKNALYVIALRDLCF